MAGIILACISREALRPRSRGRCSKGLAVESGLIAGPELHPACGMGGAHQYPRIEKLLALGFVRNAGSGSLF